MSRARRWRVLVGAAALGLAAVVAVQLYPSDRDHQAAASVQLLTAEQSPQTTLHLTSTDVERAATLSDLTARAAAQTPFAVVITANANTEGRARVLVGDATQRAQAALASGARATPEAIAQAEQDVADAQTKLTKTQGALSTADGAITDWRADRGPEDPSAQIAQIDRRLAELRDQLAAAVSAQQDTTTLDGQIAQAQQDHFDAESAQKQLAGLEDRRAAAATEVEQATAAVEAAQARLTRYQAGTTGSISVAPINTETVVAARGFGAGVTIVTLVALAATLGVLALATRPRPELALDLTAPQPADPEPAPEPEPEPEPSPAAAAQRVDGLPPRPTRPFTTVKLRSPREH